MIDVDGTTVVFSVTLKLVPFENFPDIFCVTDDVDIVVDVFTLSLFVFVVVGNHVDVVLVVVVVVSVPLHDDNAPETENNFTIKKKKIFL